MNIVMEEKNENKDKPVDKAQGKPTSPFLIITAVVLGILFLGAVAFGAYLLGVNQALQNSQKQSGVPIPATPSAATQPVASVSPSVSTSLPSPTVQPVTIQIDQEPNLPSQDVSEIKNRNINPFVDWSADQNSGGGLILIKVTTNNNDATYPYKFEYVYKNGGNGGFLIKKTAGHLDWYMPDCMVTCNFSAQFKLKYPEIVSKY